MIKLIEIYIEEFRGIKKLTLHPKSENFVIHGPNGSGKSGVVDAIDFGLTGSISRLAGKGTGSVSVKTHGPHVDARDSQNVSRVCLILEL
ncbi:MAG: AAA family ATPase [Leptolyngbyaceae cyanobacterium]